MTGQQLKNSILQMAIQGKLVPQDPNDEPASVLLERIRKEREQLVEEGKIKKEKNPSRIFRGDDGLFYEKTVKSDPVCIDDEIPFDPPATWEFIRLNDIGDYRKGPFGSSLTKSMFIPRGGDAVKVYEQKNAIQKDHTLGSYYIRRDYYESKMSSFTVLPGDIIVSCAGTIGETYIMPENIELGIINQALMRIRIYAPIDTDFFLLYFDYVIKKQAKENSKGSAIKNIPPFGVFKRIIFPLPPVEEQRRIVEMVERVSPFVDKYELTDNLLSNLNNALPEALKKSVLQEAIQGKLVPQDPQDEPASVLLERIRAEKQKLIKEGKIKKDKRESVIFRRDNSYYEKLDGVERCIDDEIPFELPVGWSWSRLGICLDVRDGTHDTPRYVSDGVPLITSKNLSNGQIDFSTAKLISKEDSEVINQRSKVDDGDIMYAMIGSIGNPVLYQGNDDFSIKNMALFKQIPNGMCMNFVYWFLILAQNDMKQQASGAVQSFISLGYIRNYLIPIPPLAEQQRIARRLDSLFDSINALRQ